MRLNNLYKNQQLMFLTSVLAVGFFSLWVLGDLASPILTSIVLAFLFRPLHVYLTKIGVPKRISIVVTFIIAITLILLFFLIFIPLFVNEANRYMRDLPNLSFITEPILAFLSDVNAPIESIEGAQSILSDISGFLSEAVVFGISRIQDTASLLLGIILVPIFLFFWL